MELNPAVDVPVTVNTVWTAPVGVNFYSILSFVENQTSRARVMPFGIDESGNYTCCTDFISTSLYFDNSTSLQSIKSQITVGKHIII